MKKMRWPVLIFWTCFLAAFPFPMIILHFIGFMIMCLLVWVKVLLFAAYGVIKYGIFLGF